MKVINIIKALKDQLPWSRLIRNIRNGSIIGLFHERSHYRDDGSPKVTYNTKASAVKAAQSMMKKRGGRFSNYKCPHCNGYHIGKSNG